MDNKPHPAFLPGHIRLPIPPRPHQPRPTSGSRSKGTIDLASTDINTAEFEGRGGSPEANYRNRYRPARPVSGVEGGPSRLEQQPPQGRLTSGSRSRSPTKRDGQIQSQSHREPVRTGLISPQGRDSRGEQVSPRTSTFVPSRASQGHALSDLLDPAPLTSTSQLNGNSNHNHNHNQTGGSTVHHQHQHQHQRQHAPAQIKTVSRSKASLGMMMGMDMDVDVVEIDGSSDIEPEATGPETEGRGSVVEAQQEGQARVAHGDGVEEDDEEEDDEQEEGNEDNADPDADEEEQVDGEMVGRAESNEPSDEQESEDDEASEEDEEDDDDDEEEEEDDKSVDLSDDEPVFISSRKPLTLDQMLSAPSSQTKQDGEQGPVRVKQESQQDGGTNGVGRAQVDTGADTEGDIQMVILDFPRSDNQTPDETGLDLPKTAGTGDMQVDAQGVVATHGSFADSTLTDLPGSIGASQAGPAAVTSSTTVEAAQTTVTAVEGTTTTTVVKEKKKRAVLTTTVPEPIIVEMRTIRLDIDLLKPAASPKTSTGKTQGKDKHGHKPLIINFKQEAIDRGVVQKGYWEGLWGLATGAEGRGEETDADDQDDSDVDMDEKAAKKVKSKSKLSVPPGQIPAPKAGPGPSSSLAALMAAVGDGPSAEAERLAAEFDKRYEGESGSKTTAEEGPVKRRRTRKAKEEEYDVADPFVDDSELMVDEPMYFQEPKRSGFYVAAGDVELCGVVEDEPAKKPRQKKANGNLAGEGDQTATATKKRKAKPILGMGIRPGMLSTEVRKSSLNNIIEGVLAPTGAPITESRQTTPEFSIVDSNIKGELINCLHMGGNILTLHDASELPPVPYHVINYVSPIEALAVMPEAIHAELAEMLRISDTCDKSNKKQFPEVLVAPCQALGQKAIDLRIMDEPFFDVLPQFTIYNRFTMKKWLLNNCKEYVPVSIANREVEIMAELRIAIDVLAVGYELERNTAIDELKSTVGETVQQRDPDTGEMTEVPTPLPPKKWKWTAVLRQLFALAVENVEYEVEYMDKYIEVMSGKIKVPIAKPKAQVIRTKLYGRVVELFPEGWMTTGVLSREMSSIKTKKKQVQA